MASTARGGVVGVLMPGAGPNDALDVIGGVDRQQHVDPIDAGAGFQRDIIDELIGGRRRVEDIGAGEGALKIAGAGDVVRAVTRRDEVVHVARAERIIGEGVTGHDIIHKIVAGPRRRRRPTTGAIAAAAAVVAGRPPRAPSRPPGVVQMSATRAHANSIHDVNDDTTTPVATRTPVAAESTVVPMPV